MSGGYLEDYGAGEEKRENLIRNSILIAVAAIALGAILIYLFRTYPEARAAKQFLNALKARDYAAAYRDWGCDASHPCPDYPMNKFLEDWGPGSKGAGSSDIHISDTESCGNGVMVTAQIGPDRQEKLFVQKGSTAVSFSPLPVCPGKGAWAIMIHRTLGKLRAIFY